VSENSAAAYSGHYRTRCFHPLFIMLIVVRPCWKASQDASTWMRAGSSVRDGTQVRPWPTGSPHGVRVRLLGHRAYGFHSAAPLIAAVYLVCGGIQWPPQLQMLRESRKWGLHDADAHRAGGPQPGRAP